MAWVRVLEDSAELRLGAMVTKVKNISIVEYYVLCGEDDMIGGGDSLQIPIQMGVNWPSI